MPKVRIHVDGLPHEEGAVYLKLLADGDPDHVQVAVVNNAGEPILDDNRWEMGSVILTVTASGYISTSPMVFPEFGFQLDHDGRVKPYPYGDAMSAKRGARPSVTVDNTAMDYSKL